MRDISSTSSLLQEISTLRNRLKDLEDDTSSSVVAAPTVADISNSPLVQMLRKDVASLEQEKAQLERDLLNQMSQQKVEFQKEMDDLKLQLQQAQSIQSKAQTHRIVDDLKESHNRELSSLQSNLLQSEHEISDLKLELDKYNHDVQDLTVQKQTLLDELTSLRLSLTDERRRNQSLNEQLDTLDSELRTKNTVDPKVLEDMQALEKRLETLQAKLAQKDSEIDSLTTQLQNASNNNKPTANKQQPARKIAGLVATFEQRSRKFSEDGSVDGYSNNSNKKTLERDTVADLREQLRKEQKKVLDLQAKLGGDRHISSLPTSETELRRAQRQIDTLQEQLRDAQKSQSRLDALMIKERAELNRLRSDVVYTDVEQKDLQWKSTQQEKELKQLRGELEAAKLQVEEVKQLRDQLIKKEKAMERLHDKHSDYKEESVETVQRLQAQVEALQSELDIAMTKVEDLESEMEHADRKEQRRLQQSETMELELTMTKARQADLIAEHAKEIQSLNEKIQNSEKADIKNKDTVDSEKEQLIKDLNQCKIKLADMEMSYSRKVQDLEGRIQQHEEERKERSHSSSFSKSQRELDSEVTRLTVELTKAQMKQADDQRNHFAKVNRLEQELQQLETDSQNELQSKQAVIDDLSSKLLRKEEQIDRLEEDKKQLRDTMQDTSFSRKGDMEELEAELMDLTSRTKSQARDIQLLKNKLEDQHAQKEELSKQQKRRIESLEEELHQVKSKFNKENRDSLTQLKAENKQLRESIRNSKMDKTVLKEKLQNYTQEKSNSRSAQVLRERNSALKMEVDKLTKRLKKMEDSITRFAI